MKEAFEKIIERLEEKFLYHMRERDVYFDDNVVLALKHLGKANAYSIAIEIVNQVAEEYKSLTIEEKSLTEKFNDGWIPCSDRLPERNEDVLVTVDVFGEMKIATASYLSDDEWFFDDEYYSITSIKWDVIAWQPLPAPYKPKGE